jgi:charged multivesicular body protein 2A
MSFLFGKKKTPREILREHQRNINRSIREIDRERVGLQNQEKKLTAEIKKLAKQGQMGSVKILAKDLVRTRQNIGKFYQMRAELQAVSLRIQTLKSQNEMANTMRGVTRVMGTMNRQMNIPQMQRIMMEFERQNEVMGMKEEMMSDAMDDAFEEEGEEEEQEQVIAAVLDEIGIDLDGELASTPTTATPAQAQAAGPVAVGAGGDDDDLAERLNNLRRD